MVTNPKPTEDGPGRPLAEGGIVSRPGSKPTLMQPQPGEVIIPLTWLGEALAESELTGESADRILGRRLRKPPGGG